MILDAFKRMLLFVISVLIYTSGAAQINNPVLNYNHFVSTLTDHYGLFPYKNINWDSLSAYYAKYVSEETPQDTLFFIMSRLAGNLRDKHLWIDNEKYAYNYSLGKVALTSQVDSIFGARRILKNSGLIKSTYLGHKYSLFELDNLLAGKINPETGYLSLDWFDENLIKSDSAISNALNVVKDSKYLIIDIRNNIGGTDSSSLLIANHLVRTNHCYQISKTRVSHEFDGYSEPIYWSTNPEDTSFNKEIIVLINRYTISAAETFCLALKNQPHIKFLGEPSAGAFSDAKDAYLPNGWHLSYSIGVWTDCNGILWEEKGIQPDVSVKITDAGSETEDQYIEQAITWLKSNGK
jgi:carboxyl-terminal processing protease